MPSFPHFLASQSVPVPAAAPVFLVTSSRTAACFNVLFPCPHIQCAAKSWWVFIPISHVPLLFCSLVSLTELRSPNWSPCRLLSSVRLHWPPAATDWADSWASCWRSSKAWPSPTSPVLLPPVHLPLISVSAGLKCLLPCICFLYFYLLKPCPKPKMPLICEFPNHTYPSRPLPNNISHEVVFSFCS